ncbi:integrase core domain-containing protein, partial [Burkholderia sp. BCC0322]|uniref:integrase core domain-containing protein n=1 Tax=Burkholderia sp. BCC0322 TaxID=2676296 RepID=UPI001FC7EF43
PSRHHVLCHSVLHTVKKLSNFLLYVESRQGHDNVFVERVWRSIKYEEVYLKAYESVSHARRSIGEYIELYNRKRPHSSLADQTPDEAYFATLPAIKSAA